MRVRTDRLRCQCECAGQYWDHPAHGTVDRLCSSNIGNDGTIVAEWTKLMSLEVDVNLSDRTFNRSLMHYVACVGIASVAQIVYDKNPKVVNAKYVLLGA